MVEFKRLHMTSLPTDFYTVADSQLDQPARVDNKYYL